MPRLAIVVNVSPHHPTPTGSSPPAPGAWATLRDWLLFLRAAVANPGQIGAVLPSSLGLARRMAAGLEAARIGRVIELGAGTGVVTEALLARGVSPSQLVVVELSPALVGVLRQRFPTLTVIAGDAGTLRELLRNAGLEPANGPTAVVSSLPLRSLPPNKVAEIVREIGALVRPSGRWIQFTYAIASRRLDPGFRRVRSSFVWLNVPPARVDVFAPLEGTADGEPLLTNGTPREVPDPRPTRARTTDEVSRLAFAADVAEPFLRLGVPMSMPTIVQKRTAPGRARGAGAIVTTLLLAALGATIPTWGEAPSGAGANPYRAIVARNAFRLSDPLPPPPPPTNPPPPPEQPKVDVKLAGLSEIKGVRYAHLMLPDPDQAGQFRYLTLTDTPEKAKRGRDRDPGGQVIVREIDLKKQTVRAVNGPIEVTLNFDEHGVKAAPAPVAAKPGAIPAPNAARQVATARTTVVTPNPAVPGASPNALSEPLIFSRNANRASGAAAPIGNNPEFFGSSGISASSVQSPNLLPTRQLRTSVVPDSPQQAAANAQPIPQATIEQQYENLLRQKQAAEAVGIPFPPIPGLPNDAVPTQ